MDNEFLSIKNLVVLMTMCIILPSIGVLSYFYKATAFLIYAFVFIILGCKVSHDALKYSFLACGIGALVSWGYRYLYYGSSIYPMFSAIVVMLFGIYKVESETDKKNLLLNIALFCPIVFCLDLYIEPIWKTVSTLAPLVAFYIALIMFHMQSSHETEDENTQKACYIASVGSFINLSFVISKMFFTGETTNINVFYDSIVNDFAIVFVIAGLAMCSYYYILGKRSRWKLANICVPAIIGLLGLSIVNLFVAKNNESAALIYYYISAVFLIYSNINFIKKYNYGTD